MGERGSLVNGKDDRTHRGRKSIPWKEAMHAKALGLAIVALILGIERSSQSDDTYGVQCSLQFGIFGDIRYTYI